MEKAEGVGIRTEDEIKERIKFLTEERNKFKIGDERRIDLNEKIDELKWVLKCPGYNVKPDGTGY